MPANDMVGFIVPLGVAAIGAAGVVLAALFANRQGKRVSDATLPADHAPSEHQEHERTRDLVRARSDELVRNIERIQRDITMPEWKRLTDRMAEKGTSNEADR